jgi:hypothetical protein
MLNAAIFGRITEIEKDEWYSVWIENGSGEFKISVGKKSTDNPKLEQLSEGDYCAFEVSLSGKRSDRGFANHSLWFRDVMNFSLEHKSQERLADKVKDDKEDGDEDLPDFLK